MNHLDGALECHPTSSQDTAEAGVGKSFNIQSTPRRILLTASAQNLRAIGRGDEALDVMQQAVEGYEGSWRRNTPAAFNSHFAASLNNVAQHLSMLGCRDEGLKAMHQAVRDMAEAGKGIPCNIQSASRYIPEQPRSHDLYSMGHQTEGAWR